MNSAQKLYLGILIPGLIATILILGIFWSRMIFVAALAFIMLVAIEFASGNGYYKWMIEEMKRKELIQEKW